MTSAATESILHTWFGDERDFPIDERYCRHSGEAGRFILAEVDVCLFAVSTFDTDDLLVKVDDLGRAIQALRGQGHAVHAPDLRT